MFAGQIDAASLSSFVSGIDRKDIEISPFKEAGQASGKKGDRLEFSKLIVGEKNARLGDPGPQRGREPYRATKAKGCSQRRRGLKSCWCENSPLAWENSPSRGK